MNSMSGRGDDSQVVRRLWTPYFVAGNLALRLIGKSGMVNTGPAGKTRTVTSHKMIAAVFIVEQVATAGVVSARRMFGHHALICDGRLTALIYDDHLLVKPTEAGRAHIGTVTEAPPVRGVVPYFLISADRCEDRAWLTTLIRVSAAELIARSKPARRKGIVRHVRQ